MGVRKEYVCLAHGPFESDDEPACCPRGCDTVERRFFTAPGGRSSRTANIDATFDRIAGQYGLTDMNNRGGKAVRDPVRVSAQQQAYADIIRERYGSTGWGTTPQGGTYNVSTGAAESVAGRVGDGAAAAAGRYGGRPEDNFTRNKPSDLALGLMPKPIIAHPDPQKLTMADARPEQHVQKRA